MCLIEPYTNYRACFSVDATYFFIDGDDETRYTLEFHCESDCDYEGEVDCHEYGEIFAAAKEELQRRGIDPNAVEIDVEKIYFTYWV